MVYPYLFVFPTREGSFMVTAELISGNKYSRYSDGDHKEDHPHYWNPQDIGLSILLYGSQFIILMDQFETKRLLKILSAPYKDFAK
jgi:hypothetical protein